MRAFLSYSRADAALARKLAAQLSERGIEVWDPAEQVLPGDDRHSRSAEPSRNLGR